MLLHTVNVAIRERDSTPYGILNIELFYGLGLGLGCTKE